MAPECLAIVDASGGLDVETFDSMTALARNAMRRAVAVLPKGPAIARLNDFRRELDAIEAEYDDEAA